MRVLYVNHPRWVISALPRRAGAEDVYLLGGSMGSGIRGRSHNRRFDNSALEMGGVTVRAEGNGINRAVVSDERGDYRIPLPAGAYTVTSSKDGYLTETNLLQVSSGWTPFLPMLRATFRAPGGRNHQGRITLQRASGIHGGHLIVVGFRIRALTRENPDSFVWLTPGSGPRMEVTRRPLSPAVGTLEFGEVRPFEVYGTFVAYVTPRRRRLRMPPESEHWARARSAVEMATRRLRETFTRVPPVLEGADPQLVRQITSRSIEATHTALESAGNALKSRSSDHDATQGVGCVFWIFAPGLRDDEVSTLVSTPPYRGLSGGLRSPGSFVLDGLEFRDDAVSGILR